IYPKEKELKDIPGVCGIVSDSIVPGFYGIEAGQSAVGDIFYWFVKKLIPKFTKDPYLYFTKKAQKIKPGQTGLISLDWHNGNRTILVDQKLTGLIVGLTLNTKPEEVFRCLIEGTGFGGRIIIERVENYGVKINEIIASGGIPEKNPLIMQIYADIMNREIKISALPQTCAVGAGIFGGIAGGYFKSVKEAQEKICKYSKKIFTPIKENVKIYERLYFLYRQLYNAFGTNNYNQSLYNVMKELLRIKKEYYE
ncbi:MAG: FGGY-family carbohydrate kinase, partial [bacterium]|nr:FGGY-family carbohydrate kinase [bacterium]MDW8164452.1 FGGY-family carbohydrate kinase [Candidatus Omnitrophota bacterium]